MWRSMTPSGCTSLVVSLLLLVPLGLFIYTPPASLIRVNRQHGQGVVEMSTYEFNSELQTCRKSLESASKPGQHLEGLCSLKSDLPLHSAFPSCGCYMDQGDFKEFKFNCQPKIEVTEDTPLVEARDRFHRSMKRTHVECKKSQRYGKVLDGGWNVCQSGPYAMNKPCIVYSFGIGRDWSFDDAISQQDGCHVYAHDPTIKKADHNRSELIHFYNRGFGGKTEKSPKGWDIRNLRDTMSGFGHTKSVIDYLKFDIEYYEWPVIENIVQDELLDNVKQIGVELHCWNDTQTEYLRYWRAMQALENRGFQRWFIDNMNYRCFKAKENGKRYCPQAHMAFINTNFLTL